MTAIAIAISTAFPVQTGGAAVTPAPPAMQETFFLLTEGGDILTDEAGNRLVWRL